MHADTEIPVSLTTLKLRPAKADDMPFIRECAKRWQLDDLAMKPEQFLIAAEADGRIFGFGRILQHPGFQEIATLGVIPEARGAGLGRLLAESLLAGCTDDDVWVATELTHWFAELGFRVMAHGPLELQSKLVLCHGEKGHPAARLMHLRKY